MNNFEKIKQMSIDEMAIFLANHVACEYCPMQKNCIAKNGCDELFKQWLLSEVSNAPIEEDEYLPF